MDREYFSVRWLLPLPHDLLSFATATATLKSLQSCPTLCDPRDGSPPDSPVPGVLQARTLEWVAISFSNAWKWKVKLKSLSRVRLFATPRTAAYQAPPSMGFSRQEYGVGYHCPLQYLLRESLCGIQPPFLFPWLIVLCSPKNFIQKEHLIHPSMLMS